MIIYYIFRSLYLITSNHFISYHIVIRYHRINTSSKPRHNDVQPMIFGSVITVVDCVCLGMVIACCFVFLSYDIRYESYDGQSYHTTIHHHSATEKRLIAWNHSQINSHRFHFPNIFFLFHFLIFNKQNEVENKKGKNNC